MNGVKWNFLILAIIAALSIIGLGIFFAEENTLGLIISFVLFCASMIFGFTLKRKSSSQ